MIVIKPVCFCNDSKGFEQYHLIEGKFIKHWNEGLTFYFYTDDGSEQTDYLANNLGWFLVSDKLKSLLTEIDKSDIQYLPVRVVNIKDNSIIKGYSVANALSVLGVLNLEHSDNSVIEADEDNVQ
ncbi:imm11 family protein [Bacillus salitolerans]|uniref:Imm11 family protein n=1 Tax=Bacillus salitolerans TaxID=1437434 RepID=A0ABW4LNZ8_9BACI